MGFCKAKFNVKIIGLFLPPASPVEVHHELCHSWVIPKPHTAGAPGVPPRCL